MTEAEFSNISMIVLLSGLIIFMGFIIWDLGKKSGAGKLGTFILFLVLGMGAIGFVLKETLVELFLH